MQAVGAVVHDEQGRLLLVLRGREPAAGVWSIPGGKVEPGEARESAVEREVLEETGLVVEVGPVLEVVTGHRWQRVEIVFAYRVTAGTTVLTSEIEELRGFAPDALPEVRADQRGLIERHAAASIAWAQRQ